MQSLKKAISAPSLCPQRISFPQSNNLLYECNPLQFVYVPVTPWCVHYVCSCERMHLFTQPERFSGENECAVQDRAAAAVGVQDSAVVCEPQPSLSELDSCWSWWHLSVSVTTQLALVFQKQLGRLIRPGPALPSKLLKLHWSGQTHTVLLKKLIQVHHLNSAGGGRLPSGHICQITRSLFLLKFPITLCAILLLAFRNEGDKITDFFMLLLVVYVR